jgi:protein-export membrane protein SecD
MARMGLAFLVFAPKSGQEHLGFRLGLDLAGGTILTYKADTSTLSSADTPDAMSTLRNIIERRVNIFGVSEPVVQTESVSLGGGAEQRLIVELPGVTDVDAAVKQLGQTPLLEFKLEHDPAPGTTTPTYVATGLTGRFLKHASIDFQGGSASIIQTPVVALQFDADGGKLFGDITSQHIGERLAIFLDGEIKGDPTIQSAITDGRAIITGLSADEAKQMASNLNFGALPIPISLVGAESIGPTLGNEVTQAGVLAGLWGFVIVAAFMILWYRLPGLVAVFGLSMYSVLMLTVFKFLPVTLTAPGIAGFILSIGMAVDAHILIFERVKEEIRSGKDVLTSISDGFSRAWLSIRDGNVTGILTAVILFYTTTSLVRGFALTLLLGITLSLFTAVAITHTLLNAVAPKKMSPAVKFLFGNGLSK